MLRGFYNAGQAMLIKQKMEIYILILQNSRIMVNYLDKIEKI